MYGIFMSHSSPGSSLGPCIIRADTWCLLGEHWALYPGGAGSNACCTPLRLTPSVSVLLALPGGEGMRPVWVPQGPPLWSQLRGYWLSPVSSWSQSGSTHSFRNSCSVKLPSSDPCSLHLEMFGRSLPCGPWPQIDQRFRAFRRRLSPSEHCVHMWKSEVQSRTFVVKRRQIRK